MLPGLPTTAAKPLARIAKAETDFAKHYWCPGTHKTECNAIRIYIIVLNSSFIHYSIYNFMSLFDYFK